jgi:serine/threonine protein kinase
MGSAEEEPPEVLVGRTIRDRYRIECLLGTGGMGAVYRVMHTGIDKPMAVKVLSHKMMQNPSVIARFEREAKAAANFGHPHVAAATDYGRTEDGRFYLVMEYVEGRELREAIDEANGPMPPIRAFYIARQIASALSRAHKLGIVHRDLKPENIMLVRREGQDDFVKVLDFGLALVSRQLSASEGADESTAKTAPKITQAGEIFGTPSYMAPEQTVSSATDIRTDLYALGILLYEMLTGLRPFVGRNMVAIIRQQLAVPPPPMKQRVPTLEIPAEMEALVMRLLAKLPEHRYQTPDELIQAIDQLGAAYNLAWPGGASSSNPAVPAAARSSADRQPSQLTLRLATIRTRFSSSLHRLRTHLLAPPAPTSGLGRVMEELQKRLAPQRRTQHLPRWLVGSGVALLFALILGVLWLAAGTTE